MSAKHRRLLRDLRAFVFETRDDARHSGCVLAPGGKPILETMDAYFREPDKQMTRLIDRIDAALKETAKP